uniref:C2H2-type domain-containing protein n=1 Tax=viral metagenome TaxID=1070528 RepID=A0A6C0I162_9ZZZZ
MPKVKINYAEMIFYKISCLSPNITKVFIGHTTNVNQRKHILKKQTQSETYYSDMIDFIKNSGGWENWILQILEKYECKTHIDIVLREIHHSDMFNKKTSVVVDNNEDCNTSDGGNVNGNNGSSVKNKNKSKSINNNNAADKIFICNHCNYRCFKSKHFKQHLITRKHLDEVQNSTASLSSSSLKISEDKKELEFYINECDDESSENKNELILQLLKDNESMKIFMKEQNDMLKEMIANHNNTTTTTNIRHKNIKQKFNINIFLNEQCKDAINLCDFIKSLKVTFHDLEITRDKSLEESVSTIMLRGLKELDVYKRPIHCTDQKRDVMYIKDEQKWEKDDGNVKLKESIDTLSKKQMYTLKELRDSDPEIKTNDDKRDKFLVTMNHVSTPITEINGKKMIKTIGKEIFIDKELDAF